MSTQIQYLRGSAAQLNAFTGASAEIVVNTTDWTLRVLDGTTVGGYPLVGLTQTQTLTNKTLVNPVITGSLTSLSVVGNISTSANFVGNGAALTGVVAATATSATTAGTVTGNAQANITSVGTLTSLNVTGNIAGGNVTTTGLVSATGNVSGGNLNVTGNIVDTGALSIITSANGNITLAPNGTGVVITNTDIRNGQASGTGNIGATGAVFNTIFAKATSAQYADLAEMYCADTKYAPGTVVVFGGDQEVTISTTSHDTAVAGIVSTNPSYLMNAALDCDTAVEVALVGRVPCRVVGIINKGDRLVSSSINGVATVMNPAQYQPGCIIGKALAQYNSDEIGTIEVAVGRD